MLQRFLSKGFALRRTNVQKKAFHVRCRGRRSMKEGKESQNLKSHDKDSNTFHMGFCTECRSRRFSKVKGATVQEKGLQ